jgi:hypothetical protein
MSLNNLNFFMFSKCKINLFIDTYKFCKNYSNKYNFKSKLSTSSKNSQVTPTELRNEDNDNDNEIVSSVLKENEIQTTHESFASVYYRYNLNKSFDVSAVRNLLYSFIFIKQRHGKMFLNISDSQFNVNFFILYFHRAIQKVKTKK